jgi:hypothetical protein
MVEAQAGKRYYSEREPCLTALWSFHFISFHFITTPSHLISIISMGFGCSLPDVVLSCFFKPARDFKDNSARYSGDSDLSSSQTAVASVDLRYQQRVLAWAQRRRRK